MSNIRIMADSTCDLSAELLGTFGISILPLNIVMDDKSFLDGVETTPDEIYAWADANKTTPKTAAPGPEAAIEFLKQAKEAGDEVCFLGISEQMSSTCQVLRLAAEELEYTEHVHVIDSKNLSTGIGLQVLYAAELAKEGVSLDELEEKLKAYRERVRASFVVDTLTYLQRGGRCSAVTALLGNTLKLKPRIAVTDGKMGVSKKYRGNKKKTVLEYVKDMEADLVKAEKKRVFITHSGIEQEIIDGVKAYLTSLNHFENIYVTRAGGVISSHCGAGTLGVLFVDGE
ncbi:MAG: DegV family protein [Lachnospiraceae bacterium]|nr:DegV family protein [Lachnospiraceae bacterium]